MTAGPNLLQGGPPANAACDGYIADPGGSTWPSALRVRDVQGAPGVWEMTWSFSGPDGRATFEWVQVDLTDGAGRAIKVPAVRWRRVGDPRIFTGP